MTSLAPRPVPRAPGAPASAGAGGSRTSVIVVGAGLGGRAAAVRLAHAGYQVTVLERHDVPGGRAGVWQSQGFTFDTGPSMVMMAEGWRTLFTDVGRRFEDYVTLVQCDPNYRLTYK